MALNLYRRTPKTSIIQSFGRALTSSRQHRLFSSQSVHKAQNKNAYTIVRVMGPHPAKGDKVEEELLSQLRQIPKDIQALKIEEDPPSDLEWKVLGDHFSQIKELEMDSGFQEDLNDKHMPLHWPIERLLISSACGEVFQSRFITEGKIKHLILLLTSGLRFEGPTSDELKQDYHKAIERKEKEPRFAGRIQIINIPELVSEWMNDHYSKMQEMYENAGSGCREILDRQKMKSEPQKMFRKEVSVNLEKLEILENDAIDAFDRMALALPHVVEGLSTLNIRSTHGLDFHFTNEKLFPLYLCQLERLRTLVLSVGDVFTLDSLLPEIYQNFPPNLTTLRFRGPVSLAKSDQWSNWIKSFASSDYLPNLKTLSFVLDLNYEYREDEKRKRPTDVSDEALRDARSACEELYTVARCRGITIEPFCDKWSEWSTLFKQVDERWTWPSLR